MTSQAVVSLPDKPWARSPNDILQHLYIDPHRGLDRVAIAKRSEQFGPNSLPYTFGKTIEYGS